MKTAILVIDMQHDFFQQGRLKDIRSSLCKNINQLIEVGRNHQLKIIWIRQVFKTDLSDAFLVMKKRNIRITMENTEGAQFLDELNKNEIDCEIIKKRYSAFYNTNLDEIIKENEIKQVILCGVNSHACIRTTAIDAYQRDLEVIIAEDCVDSQDEAHHKLSLHYLGKEISEVMHSRSIVKNLLNLTQS